MPRKISLLSLQSLKLNILSRVEWLEDQEISTATWFLLHYEWSYYLVTNWHVVSWKHFKTWDLLDSLWRIPTHIKTTIKINQLTWVGQEFIQRDCQVDIPLISNEWFLRYEHPIHSNNIDVVVIKWPQINFWESLKLQLLNVKEETDKDIELRVMDKIFIVWYPYWITPNNYPIYKSWYIASEPEIYTTTPFIYIDSKTKPGMSWSPVYKIGEQKIDLKEHCITQIPWRSDFIGIYTGRDGLAEDEYQAELWIIRPYKECIMPILESIL